MKIPIPKTKIDLEKLMRRLDYQLDRKNKSDEQAFYRRMRSGRFPRFHIYIAEKEDRWIFKLHLDQKGHSYEGQTAHGGEYEGPKVEEEANRIKHGVALVLKEEKGVEKKEEEVESDGSMGPTKILGTLIVFWVVASLIWVFVF